MTDQLTAKAVTVNLEPATVRAVVASPTMEVTTVPLSLSSWRAGRTLTPRSCPCRQVTPGHDEDLSARRSSPPTDVGLNCFLVYLPLVDYGPLFLRQKVRSTLL